MMSYFLIEMYFPKGCIVMKSVRKMMEKINEK